MLFAFLGEQSMPVMDRHIVVAKQTIRVLQAAHSYCVGSCGYYAGKRQRIYS